jgi:hypothetical protein
MTGPLVYQPVDIVSRSEPRYGARERSDENACFGESVRLPQGDRAEVLNMRHREGRHKARVFEAVLGITAENAAVLRDALLAAAATDEIESQRDSGFGVTYVLRRRLTAAKGTGTVRSVWIVRHGEDFPRLTTCYIV